MEIEIVLPSSEIATASQLSHPDLFRALKGAGQNNFGVVTSFTLKAFELPNPNLWFATAVYGWDKAAALINARHKYAIESVPRDVLPVAQLSAFAWVPGHGKFIMTQTCHVDHPHNDSWPESISHTRRLSHCRRRQTSKSYQ